MHLKGEAGIQKAVRDPKIFTTLVNTELLIKSIGYQCKPIDGLPFDPKNCTVPHNHGCVLTDAKEGKMIPGLYVSGWLKRGPVGIIDSTLRDSVDTFRVIKYHLECDVLPEKQTSPDEVLKVIAEKSREKVVTYKDWQKIDAVER